MPKIRKKIVLLTDSEDDSDDNNDNDNVKKTLNKVRPSFVSSNVVNSYRKFLNDDEKWKKILENDDHVKKKLLVNNHHKIVDDKLSGTGDSDVKNKNHNHNDHCKQNDDQIQPMDSTSFKKRRVTSDSLEIIELTDDSKSPLPSMNSSIIYDYEEIDDVLYDWIRIRIKRLDRIEYFKMLRTATFSSIFDQIAELADIFEMFVRSDEQRLDDSMANEIGPNTQNDDPNVIELHLRDSNKKRLTCFVNRFENVQYLAEIYAKDRCIPIEKILLKFDYEPMNLMEKIDTYDLENDDQIDVIIKQ
ncbi:hypothetical protein DERF_014724 [Dermatophagoides farinae]|uniref:Rad60/SUMO-like domain-containing protein n=1 Tax=Dermatophagoides farinae TaxID=6954 RepID=A0A922HPR0_DERFA|nr:hypothetical protein DERF_014724 [Dermatophagoides farinae]